MKRIRFQQDCSGYLKQAADANTPELAISRLDLAIKYLQDNNLTTGYTSVLWRTEDQNIEFWYQNLKACREELENCLDGSQLEKSNVLMKVRESLTDEGEKGTKLTIPKNIMFYPDNATYLFLRTLSYLAIFVAFCYLAVKLES